MTDTDRDMMLEDEDRLPWLEAVESDDEDEGLSGTKLVGLVLAGLMVLAIGGGGWWWSNHQGATSAASGDGNLIAAAEGDYKVKPDAPGGMKVDGQGDAAFATSEGAETNGKVAPNAGTEAPVAGIKVNPAAASNAPVAGGKAGLTTSVPAPAAPAPAAPVVAGPAATAAGGAMIQLGAFGSQAMADSQWAAAVRKHPELANLSKSVQAANVGRGTIYRLRANAGTAANAAALCAKVSPCMLVH